MIFVRVGEWNAQKTNEPETHEDYAVKFVIIHQKFEPKKLWNDIAVLVLYDDVSFKTNVEQICLPQNILVSPSECIVTGWGKNNFGIFNDGITKSSSIFFCRKWPIFCYFERDQSKYLGS